MLSLTDWLMSVPGHRLVPLFEADDGVVRTREAGREKRRLLCRSPEMEAAVIELVEAGLTRDDWQGLLYVMGWGTGPAFRPLYVGRAGRRGRGENPLSANLKNIRTDRNKFARWGDGLAYHIGDLSLAVFGLQDTQHRSKYADWADKLFESLEPPRLQRTVTLYLAPWADGAVGPFGRPASLAQAEMQVIDLASAEFADSLLNVDGV